MKPNNVYDPFTGTKLTMTLHDAHRIERASDGQRAESPEQMLDVSPGSNPFGDSRRRRRGTIRGRRLA